jgi:hypothetical protein
LNMMSRMVSLKSSTAWMTTVLILLIQLVTTKSNPCPNLCSSHGRCSRPGRVCDCNEGYTGADCSLRLCPVSSAWVDQAVAVDDAHNSAECSNMGLCDRETGLCACREGFEGVACERQTCENHCGGVGECQSMLYLALNKDPGSGEVFKYETPWDAEKIYGCACDSKYHGTDCSLRYCPKGDDPLTGTNQISTLNPLQYNELQRVTCRADGGTFSLTYKGKTSKRIPYNAIASDLQALIEDIPTVGKGNIKLVMSAPQACIDHHDGTVWTVEFLQDFGSLTLMVPDTRFLEMSNFVVGKILTVVKYVDGTKENLECSDRGTCDVQSGVCQCSNDFETSNGYNVEGVRGDCGYATESIQYCPGDIACSAHGHCLNNPTYKCQCSAGWTGADCSEQLCPSDLLWFSLPEDNNQAHTSAYTECSGAGNCDRATGECQCNVGFTGASCNRLSCPGQTDDTEACYGHGRCLDMNTLASLATVNGDLATFTYGEIPNDPNTWDAYRMFGCLCDPQYEGYDCSLYVCPYGDNPDTQGQLDEEQILSCTDDGQDGSIVFTFRQQVSVPVSPTATTADVKAALEALSTVLEVAVDVYTPGNEDSLCTVGGNQFLITFLTEHADLPMIQYVAQNIDTFDISQYQAGNKENWECSGRGLCDHGTGECECFTGFGSSDGKGGPGTLRDCAYIEPHVKPVMSA